MSFTEEQKRIMRDAIETYGIPAQTDMMIEEMSELTKALLKLRRVRGCGLEDPLARNAVLEEMADVGIMLRQMVMIYGDPSYWTVRKLERLRERIEEARNG